jgi:hypothetical protein
MKNSLIVVSMVLIWAAHSGTASGQGSSDSSLAYTCALACEQQLGASCHDEQALTACLEQRPECGGDQELVRMARAFMDGRTTCPQPSSPTVVPAPAPTPRPRPRVRPRRQPQQAVAVAPASSRELTTAEREALMREIQDLLRTTVPAQTPAPTATAPAVEPRPLQEDAALRAEIDAMRRELVRIDERLSQSDSLTIIEVRNALREVWRAQACRTGRSYEFTIGGRTETVTCDEIAPTPETRRRVQIPQGERRASRGTRSSGGGLTGDRIGLIIEATYAMSRYHLVAHDGSKSPRFVGFGLGLTIRLADHFYLAGVVDAGAGLRDGEHVPALGQVHYRIGLLGVAARHLLLGANLHFGHRYSGNGELAEQNGTWYQLRQRGLRLDVGYLWRENGWSPFVMASAMLGVGCHADRRLDAGEQCLFDPGFMITFGGMRLRAP